MHKQANGLEEGFFRHDFLSSKHQSLWAIAMAETQIDLDETNDLKHA